MPLDSRIKKLLESGFIIPIGKASVDEVRKIFRQLASAAPKVEVGKVEDIKIPGSETNINARVYFPKANGPYGVLVYFHGGGFVIGDVESYDPLCRAITNACNCVVVSVDYRLAPEYKFPSAVIDAFDATNWVYNNLEKFNGKMGVAVAGDSAGGNLAAVVALLSKGKINLKYQILIYPAVGFDNVSRSMIEYSDGFFLTREHIEWFGSQYLRSPADLLDFRFSPIIAQDLSGLPPALIITAEYDPLRDQGEAYGNKLLQAGVPVTSVRFNNVIHGFLSFFPLIEQGRDAIGLIGSILRRVFYEKI
ncbi:alpha/beta hydrolase fold domain-containing protein [Sulfolobus sp. E5-1-F]|uniref:alpha/beta hydrolase n=1 Tax=Saccharolobus sp. E5-1-F TaxID=2663019 RepID=UPI001294D7F6|nr:alpha/beta hydrolase [Sulfolobus sp. E5-1-F]QGA53633.1 alpha/beta hydrolase fold domain-containing protein [Sulfolobus sp. E5-1-F]